MTAQADRLNTAHAGRYCIMRRLGEGGMATVYYDGRTQCDVSRDGQRFLMVRKIGGGCLTRSVVLDSFN